MADLFKSFTFIFTVSWEYGSQQSSRGVLISCMARVVWFYLAIPSSSQLARKGHTNTGLSFLPYPVTIFVNFCMCVTSTTLFQESNKFWYRFNLYLKIIRICLGHPDAMQFGCWDTEMKCNLVIGDKKWSAIWLYGTLKRSAVSSINLLEGKFPNLFF